MNTLNFTQNVPVSVKQQIVTRKGIVAEVKALLKNRRWVFFKTYPNAAKQQIIIDAEVRILMIENRDMETFKAQIKTFADKYLVALVPSVDSPMHSCVVDLITKIKNLK